MVASALLAALLCEAALRLLLPKYRDVAEGHWQLEDLRGFNQSLNARGWRFHPDTGRLYPHHTNNLGLRQHRDFSDADLKFATTVGVFGDSFVHSPYLDAPYVFTEPLDYLLNLDGNFTVLNFGLGGYGPGQSYLTYRIFHAREDLDYVLFVYFGGNDMAELVHNRLFDLDDGGRLRQQEVRGSAWWVPFASRLHLTYLVLDAIGGLAPYIAGLADQIMGDPRSQRPLPGGGVGEVLLARDLFDHGLEVFRQLIRRWRDEVEASGAKFFVVLLPTQPDFPWVRPLLAEAGVGMVDLNACFASRDEGHRGRAWRESPYRFENDFHWNELGNRQAAACLDDRLRREAGLPTMAEAERDAALAEYYAAFDDSPSPAEAPSCEGCALALKAPQERVRSKYQALGGVEAAAEFYLRPANLVLDSDPYDVYVVDRLAIVAKNDCQADDETVFAHATPVDASILPPNTGYLSLGTRAFLPLQEDGRCIARWRLPQFPVSHILVGQGDSATATLWSGEIVLDQAAFEKTLEHMLIAAGEPIIESDMDVHVHGQRIFYVSDDCQRTDGRTSFFLHVSPAREADLPPERIEHGYDNLDFFQAGATVGERCVVRWHLPDYPIRHIRTGQYVAVRDGELRLPRLWEGESDIGG